MAAAADAPSEAETLSCGFLLFRDGCVKEEESSNSTSSTPSRKYNENESKSESWSIAQDGPTLADLAKYTHDYSRMAGPTDEMMNYMHVPSYDTFSDCESNYTECTIPEQD